jgi:hypothetical protein
MAFAVKKLPDEPIVIVTIDLPVHEYEQNFRNLSDQLARLAENTTERVDVILDGRALDLSFSDVLLLIDLGQDSPAGTFADPRLHWNIVGTHPLFAIAVKKVRQQLSATMDLFATLEDALIAVRQR